MSAEVVQTPVETEKPSDTKESTEAPVEAAKLLAQGKRNLLCGEIPTAVNELQEACALLAASFGETAKECGDSYFYYGQSLLELARMETGVLGNALQGVPEEDTEDEAVPSEQFERAEAVTGEELEQIRDKVYDAMSEPDPPKSKEIGNVEAKEEKSGESAMETEENKENVTEEKENAPEEKVAEDGGKKQLENKSEEIKNEKNALSDKTTEVINTDEKVIEGKDDKTDKLVNGDIDKQDKKNEVDIASDKNNSSSADGATKQLNGDGQTQTEEEAKKEAAGEEMETSAKEGEEEEGEEGGTEEDEETADEENADPGEGTSTAPQEEDADDIPNLQLAWEMLDLAKVIYLKQEGKEMRLKAAEAYLKLGEVSIESEQYEQAISDIGDCLKIQQEQLEEDDRLLAETQYQLGLAYSFHKKFDEAIDSFRGAIKVIEDRIGKLKAIIEKEKPGEEKTTEVKPEEQKTEDQSKEEAEKKTEECKEADPVKAAEKEIQDLAGILPDIRAKIEDVVEERKNMDVVREMAKEAVSSLMKAEETIGTQPISNESATKATDISHLIRKKRKPESDTEEEAETKKCRQEDGSGDANKVPNGNHPVTNGDSTPANDTDTLLTNGEKPTANGDSADSKEEIKSKDCAAELKSKDVPMETAEGVST